MSGIQVRIGADTAGLEAGLRRSGQLVANTSREMSRNLKVAAKWTAGITAAGAAISTHLINNTMKAVDEQAKLARSLGTTIDSITALQLAASESGVDGLEASLNRLNRRLGAAEQGTGRAGQAIEALNLDLEELSQMDVADRVFAISDAMRESGISMQQAARHAQNLGFEQREAAAFFMQGGDALREYVDQVDRFGLSISEIDAARIEQANDAMGRIGLSARGVRQTLAIELSDTITAVADQITEDFGTAGRNMQEEIADAVKAAREVFADMIGVAATVSETLANNPAIGQFGLVGMAIFGKKGAVIGAAIGAAFEAVKREAEKLGIGLSDAENNAQMLVGVMEDIEKAEERLARARELGHEETSEFIQDEIQLLEELRGRQEDLEGSVNDSNESLEHFNSLMDDNSGGMFVSTLRNVEAAIRGVGDAADDAADGSMGSVITEETVEETRRLAGELMPIQENAQQESANSYLRFLEDRAQQAEDHKEEMIRIAREEEEEKFRIRRENVQATMGLASSLAGFGAQMSSNQVQAEREAAREIMDTMRDQINSSEDMTDEEKESVKQAAREKVEAREQEARRSFETQKDFQRAAVAINTAGAIMNELATNPNPFAKWLNVAAITATGLTQAAAINSASMGGGFNIPSGGGGASQAQGNNQQGGGQQQPTQIANFSLVGDVFGREQVIGLIEQINDAVGDGVVLRGS